MEKGNDEFKAFKQEIRARKAAFKQQIKSQEDQAVQHKLEQAQLRKDRENQNRKKVEGKAGMLRSERPPLKKLEEHVLVDQDQLDFQRFIGEVEEDENHNKSNQT